MRTQLLPTNKTGKWYDIKNDAGEGPAEIFIYDVIGQTWYGDGVDAKGFAQQLLELKDKDLLVHINSPGGSLVDGIVIHNALLNHPKKVDISIEGWAASIASIIALAGDTVRMADNAFFMIHDPSTSMSGTSSDMRDMADFLDAQKANLVDIYVKHSSLSSDEIAQAMQDETWYDAKAALAAGFIDEISTGKKATASALSSFSEIFNKLPESLKNELCKCETPKNVAISLKFEKHFREAVSKAIKEAADSLKPKKEPENESAWRRSLAQKRMDLLK